MPDCIVRFWRATERGRRPLARGNFGYSLAYSGPVSVLLGERIRATLLLTGTATLGAWLLALPLGIWSATQRRGWGDAFSRVLFTVLLMFRIFCWRSPSWRWPSRPAGFRRVGSRRQARPR